jgi:phenylacetate-coenzyme A ligase PaaK-like adenylate-forming protein
MIDIAFDDISARVHRVQLDRARSLYSQAAASPEEIMALAELHRREHSDYLAGISEVMSRRLNAGWAAASAGVRPELTSRDEIIALREKTLTLDSELFLRYAETTTGSTGRPFRVRRTAHSFQRELLRLRWALRYYATYLGLPTAGTIVYLSHYPGALSHFHIDKSDGELRIVKLALRRESLEEDMRRVDEYARGRFVLSGTPSTLHWLLSSGVRLSQAPRFILAAGEAYPADLRKDAATWFACPVFEQYVMREVGLTGTECVQGGGLHLFCPDVMLGSCKRQLWVTDLTNRIDLYVNYLTGDTGDLGAVTRCRCGVAWPLLREFQGRAFGKPMSSAPVRG